MAKKNTKEKPESTSAVFRNLRISAKKLSLEAKDFTGVKVFSALERLKLSPRKSSGLLAKAIASASSNAENNLGKNVDLLVIDRLVIGRGRQYARYNPRARGRADRRLLRTSHIRVELRESLAQTASKKLESPEASKKETKQKEAKSSE